MTPTRKSNHISIRKKKAAAKKANNNKKKKISKSGRKPALKIIKKVAPPPMIPIEETCMDEGVDYSGMPELQCHGAHYDDDDSDDEADGQTILNRSVWNIKSFKKAEETLTSFMSDCGEGLSSIDSISSWVQSMSCTGFLHGSTLCCSRLVVMPEFMRWRNIKAPTFDAYETKMMTETTGAIVGMTPEGLVF